MLCIGPELSKEIYIAKNVIVKPAGFLGTRYPTFLAEFVSKFLGQNIEFEVHQSPLVPPEKSEPVVSIEFKVMAINHEQAIKNALPVLEKSRNALASGYSASIKTFGTVSVKDSVGFLATELPRETGLDWKFPEDGNDYPNEASISMNKALAEDLRFEHLLDLYHQAMGAEHPDLQVSMLYLTLEAIVSGLNKQMGGNRSKNAILLDLEYSEHTLPLFQIGEKTPQQINHIDLAYEIRNSFFHGGRDHSNPVASHLKDALEMYKQAPELLSLALTYDCWKGLYLWAKKSSKAYKAWQGNEISLERSVTEPGLHYKMHYIARDAPGKGVAGTLIRPGSEVGIVYFAFIIRFRQNRVALQIQAPGGKDPDAKSKFPLGYKLFLP